MSARFNNGNPFIYCDGCEIVLDYYPATDGTSLTSICIRSKKGKKLHYCSKECFDTHYMSFRKGQFELVYCSDPWPFRKKRSS